MLSLRSTHLPTDGRPGAKTPGLENAIHRAVDKAASKSNAAVPLQSNTQSRVHKDKDANVGGTKSLAREAARPLGDRTPFPNRDTTIVSNRFNAANTPLPDNQKLAKLLLEANRTNALYHSPLDNTPVSDSVPRASAGRTYVRAPRLSVIQQNTFETPLNNGRHWDVSEAEISVPEVWADSPAGGLELDDYDEVEYMPPKVVDTYTPPFDFDLPNYSAVGKTLLNLSYSRPYDDEPPVGMDPSAESVNWAMFTFPEIKSDDPFQQRAANVVALSMEKSAPKRPRAVPSSRSNSRPGTSTPSTRDPRAKLPLRLRTNPASATNTTLGAGSKMPAVQTPKHRLNAQRPATAAAMYCSKRSLDASVFPSKWPAAAQVKNVRNGDEFTTLEISSQEIEDDFLFDV